MQNKPDSKEPLLSIGEAAEYLGTSVDTLRRWDKKGKVETYRSPGGHRYFKRSDLDELFGTKYERTDDDGDEKEEDKEKEKEKDEEEKVTVEEKGEDKEEEPEEEVGKTERETEDDKAPEKEEKEELKIPTSNLSEKTPDHYSPPSKFDKLLSQTEVKKAEPISQAGSKQAEPEQGQEVPTERQEEPKATESTGSEESILIPRVKPQTTETESKPESSVQEETAGKKSFFDFSTRDLVIIILSFLFLANVVLFIFWVTRNSTISALP